MLNYKIIIKKYDTKSNKNCDLLILLETFFIIFFENKTQTYKLLIKNANYKFIFQFFYYSNFKYDKRILISQKHSMNCIAIGSDFYLFFVLKKL